MFIYFGKRFESTRVGGAIIGVNCDKCGCLYYYELGRVGTGTSEAPYNLGTGAAARSAQEASERDLQVRLASEAELVPCPACHWINDELVRGYRQTRYQRFPVVGFILSIIGTAMSLICAWPISLGPPRDRWLLPYLLFVGPAFFASFTVGLLLLQKWLRSFIQPNRGFPRPPKLPPGTPPALLMNPATEELRLAKPNEAPGSIDDWQVFQLGRHRFPLQCCNCLAPATTEHAHVINVTRLIRLEIPRCASCAQQSVPMGKFGWLIFAAIIALIAGMAYVFWQVDADYSCTMNGGLLVLFFASVAAIAYTVPGPPGPVEAEVADPSRGVVRLRFRNPKYAWLVATQEIHTDETATTNAPAPSSTAISSAKDHGQMERH